MMEVISAVVAVVAVVAIFAMGWLLATSPDPERNARAAAIYTRANAGFHVPKAAIPTLVGAIFAGVPEATLVRLRYDQPLGVGSVVLELDVVIPWPRAARRADLERLERDAVAAVADVAPEWMRTRVKAVRR